MRKASGKQITSTGETTWAGNADIAATADRRSTPWLPRPRSRNTIPTDEKGFCAADFENPQDDIERAMYDRLRTRIRFIAVDPEETLIFRGDDVIARVWPVDRRAGVVVDLKLDHHPTRYGLDDWDQARRIVVAVVATDRHFA